MKLLQLASCKDWLPIKMTSLLAFLGLSSLIISKIIPPELLKNIEPLRPLPIHLTLIRAWFYSHTDTTSFIIALQYFAFWCFSAAAITFIFLLILQRFWFKHNKYSKHKYTLIFILLAIFAFSVGIKWPTLNRPLGVRNEILTADTLVALQIWQKRNIGDHYFIRNHTFPNLADRNILASCTAITPTGDCFYVSYPPFATMMPHFIFSLFGLEPTQFWLQLFNIFLHLVSAIFVYLIIKLLTLGSNQRFSTSAALIGYAFYIFAPLPMVVHTDAYLSEMAIQPFWVGGIYLFLRLVLIKKNKFFDFALFGVCIFLAAYTEWLGFLLAGTAGLYAIINWRKSWSKKILLVSFLGASSALALTLWQMHLALGLKTALEALKIKFLIRTGAEATTEYSRLSPHAWFKIILNYLRGYDFILIATLIAIITLLKKKRRLIIDWLKSAAATPLLTFLFIAGLPVCLHHALLFQWTAIHPFSPLKTAPIIMVVAGVCLGYLISQTASSLKVITTWKLTIFFVIILSVLSFLCKTTFYSSELKNFGQTIHNLAKQNEVVFTKLVNDKKQLKQESNQAFYALYSGRNVAIWNNLDEAKKLLQKNGVSNGILFEMNAADSTSLKYVRFTSQSTEADLEAGFDRYNH